MTVLDDLVAGALADLMPRMNAVPMDQIEQLAHDAAPALDPMPAFAAPGLSIIAEVKRSSPSKGHLATITDPAALANQYAEGGASAISVLTEQRRFGGSLADLDAVRAKVPATPVLRKDFMVTPYQILEARAHGADLALLIVAGLSTQVLTELYQLTIDLGMTPLVEVHTQAEARVAIDLGARLIGVNNRNLATLDVDIEQFGRIVEVLPDECTKVAESGITTPADAARMADQGADVILVGEALVRHGSAIDGVRDFITAGRADRQQR